MHYAYTLENWYYRFTYNKDKIIKMYEEKFFYKQKFYLLISKYSFKNMGNTAFQIQIAKNMNNLPLTRNYIYN